VRDNAAADIESADARWHLHSQTNLARHAEAGALMITGGSGPYVSDASGRRYLDAVASLWCASLGFSDHRLAEAGSRALATLPCYHTFNHRSNPWCAELSAAVAALAPFADAKVFFTDGGSTAIESMIKMAWYYQVARGRPGKRKIIARNGGFHGSTVLAARLSGLPAMHQSFNLPDCNVIHAGRPHHYRDARPGETPAAFAERLAAELEGLIEAEGADTIAAFIAEPVMGAGGVIVPPPGYFERVGELLRRHDILLLADEIICGFGRTGSWFGCQTLGFRPDMLTIAKGLSAGYMPIGGVVVAPEIFATIAEESHKHGTFSHGFTYSGHPVAAAVACEALRVYRAMDLPAVALRLGGHLARRLDRLREHPLVGDIRTLGFLAGIELMADGERRVAFPPERKVGAMVERRTREHGLIVRNLGDVIAICPPYIVSEAEIDQLVEALGRALDDVAGELRGAAPPAADFSIVQ
jgi:4-aminobutyrate--pyruvate transaminase